MTLADILLFILTVIFLFLPFYFMLGPSLNSILKEAWDRLDFFDWNKK